MKELNDFSDVLATDIAIEETKAIEFEFENFTFRRERHHWEIQFEDQEGEQGIVVEREDFIDGRLEFEINLGIEGILKECLLLEDFDRIEEFAYGNRLLSG